MQELEVKKNEAHSNLDDSATPANVIDREAEQQNINPNPQVVSINKSAKPEAPTVRIYGQIHFRSEQTAKERQDIGMQQCELLESLQTDQPKHVFDEGVRVGGEALYVSDNFKERFKSTFPDGLDLFDMSKYQMSFIAENGAARIYAAMNPDVKIHGVTSEAIEVEVNKHLANLSEDPLEAAKEGAIG